MSLFAITLVTAMAGAIPPAIDSVLPDAAGIRAAADRCEVPPSVLFAATDESGGYAEIDPGEDDSALLAGRIQCFLAWAEDTGARIAFRAEPNGTQPVATGYAAGILELRQASRTCGLPARVAALPGDRYVLLVHRPAVGDGLECLLAWLDENRTRLELTPLAASPPDAAAVQSASDRCGVPREFLRMGQDPDGTFADAVPPADLDRLRTENLICLIRWAHENKARIGFVSEPPPGPVRIAFGPVESVRALAEAARTTCNLAVHLDPLGDGKATLKVRRNAPAEAMVCITDWIDVHGERIGLEPIPDF